MVSNFQQLVGFPHHVTGRRTRYRGCGGFALIDHLHFGDRSNSSDQHGPSRGIDLCTVVCNEHCSVAGAGNSGPCRAQHPSRERLERPTNCLADHRASEGAGHESICRFELSTSGGFADQSVGRHRPGRPERACLVHRRGVEHGASAGDDHRAMGCSLDHPSGRPGV